MFGQIVGGATENVAVGNGLIVTMVCCPEMFAEHGLVPVMATLTNA